MVPSETPSNIYLHNVMTDLNYHPTFVDKPPYNHKFQHLSLLSDDVIVDNDICYYENSLGGGKFLCKAHQTTNGMVYHQLNIDPIENYGSIDGGITPLDDDISKVIATTDSELFVLNSGIECECPSSKHREQCKDMVCRTFLPSFTDEFIKEFVKANGIDEVMVGYEDILKWKQDTYEDGSHARSESQHKVGERLILTDNKVSITLIEEPKMYTQTEVIVMLTKERERGIEIANAFNNKYTTKANDYLKGDGSLKYIAEREAEVCRKIEITIDGRTLGLEPHLHNQIKQEYFK